MLAIVFDPRKAGFLNSQVFHYPINRVPAAKVNKADATPVELGLLELKKGLNLVDPVVWKQVESHPVNRDVINKQASKGALQVYTPDVEEPIGATSDFNDLGVVAEIINACGDRDLEWLDRCLSQDRRPQVFKLGSTRIQELKEDRADRKQQSMSME